MFKKLTSNRKNLLKLVPILLLLFIVSCCGNAIITRSYTPQERICDNLVDAGMFDRERCMLTGEPRDYLAVYFQTGQTSVDYVKTGMEGFPLISESTGRRSTQYYILERNILGIPLYLVRFVFDDGLLFEISISD